MTATFLKQPEVLEVLKGWTEKLGYTPTFDCNGKIQCLNPRLLQTKQIPESRFDEMVKLHIEKDTIMRYMQLIGGQREIQKVALRQYAKKITKIEFALQGLWGFGQDENFHRWWELPKCSCPKMDNEEHWGTEFRVINQNCILHGTV